MDTFTKPYSESCEQNRGPILSIIRPLLSECNAVLEIGSGTGQHAVYFGAQMPHLTWYPSDREEHHAGIKLWIEDAGVQNVRPPLHLDVTQLDWPEVAVDAIVSANTAHIMDWEAVQALFSGVGRCLADKGLFLLYGPFNYGNRYTSDSNERFDGWLKDRDPSSGIRNFEDIDQLANQAGMVLVQDYEMPANNRILYWQKQQSG